jgi:CBS domain-containing protein
MGMLKRILKRRTPVLCILPPTASVQDALSMMVEKKVGIVSICENGDFLGVFSERDLCVRVIHAGKDLEQTPLAEVMTTDPVIARSTENREAASQRMRKRGCRHLPIFEGGRLIDMLSMRDLLKDCVKDQRKEIRLMRDYIRGEAEMGGLA